MSSLTKYSIATIIVGGLLLITQLTIVDRVDAKEGQIVSVVFRYDDYGSQGSESMTALEYWLIEEFDNRGQSITFGVIPFESNVALAGEKASRLKEATKSSVELALHGYSHQNNGGGEFPPLSYQEQLNLIQEGADLLQDVTDLRPAIFIPPFNQYDSNTLRAMSQARLRIVSADTKGEVVQDSGLSYLPATTTILRLREAVDEARDLDDVNPIVVVLFHAPDFQEVGTGSLSRETLRAALDWIESQPDVRVASMSDLLENGIDLGPERLDATLKLRNLIDNRFVPGRFDPQAYPDTQDANSLADMIRLTTAGIYTALYLASGGTALAAFFIAGRFFRPMQQIVSKTRFLWSLIVVLAIAGVLFADVDIRLVFITTLATGTATGLWIGQAWRVIRERRITASSQSKVSP